MLFFSDSERFFSGISGQVTWNVLANRMTVCFFVVSFHWPSPSLGGGQKGAAAPFSLAREHSFFSFFQLLLKIPPISTPPRGPSAILRVLVQVAEIADRLQLVIIFPGDK